jgi:BON domain
MRWMQWCRLLFAMLVCIPVAHAADELRNWFDDPFFQVTSALADCPPPAGPFVDERGRREQAHRRAEKGTTCWLAGECERPKAYAYDQDIAAAIRQAFAGNTAFASTTTLWVTVQGRVVYVEGCVSGPAAEPQIESLVRSLPYVQQAIAIVRTDGNARPPYKLRHTD